MYKEELVLLFFRGFGLFTSGVATPKIGEVAHVLIKFGFFWFFLFYSVLFDTRAPSWSRFVWFFLEEPKYCFFFGENGPKKNKKEMIRGFPVDLGKLLGELFFFN